MAGLKGLLRWVQRSRAYRANERLGMARGGILSAGIAFFGVFSLFPLLVLGFTVLGVVIGGNEELQDQITGYVRGALPGVIGTGDGAIVSTDELLSQATSPTALGLSAAIGLITLLYTGLGWIAALREGIRGVFQLPTFQLDPVRAKLFDLAVLLTLGVLIVVSALASVLAQTFTERLLDVVGQSGSDLGRAALAVVVFVGSVLINTALFTVLFRVLANSDQPYREIVGGAVLAAVGVGVLQLFVGVVLRNVGGGFSFLESAVPILTLFVWLNLTARVMLFGAAWGAVGPDPAVDAAPLQAAAAGAMPVAPREGLGRVMPVRSSDRVVLGAGVVLGATVIGLAHLTGSAIRTVGSGLRGMVHHDQHRDS